MNEIEQELINACVHHNSIQIVLINEKIEFERIKNNFSQHEFMLNRLNEKKERILIFTEKLENAKMRMETAVRRFNETTIYSSLSGE
jgi:predicted  nucleic acid-binding Zn-ribbon protein